MMLRCSGWSMVLFAVGAVVLASGSAACADTSPASVLASLPDTIATGELHILGNKIEPPYVFEAVRDSLYVNGILVYPYRDFTAPPEAADSVTVFDRRLAQLGSAMGDSGRTAAEITNAVAEMLRARTDLFSKVEVQDATSLVRWYADNGQPEAVQYRWGQRRPPRTLAEKTAFKVTYITYGLARNGVVFVGEDGGMRMFDRETSTEEYNLWVLLQLESPGQPRRLSERGAGSLPQP